MENFEYGIYRRLLLFSQKSFIINADRVLIKYGSGMAEQLLDNTSLN